MRKNAPLLGQVFKKVAPKIGAKVFLEPKWNIVGQITFKSGRRQYFRYSSLGINTLGPSEIAKDKDYANFFMKHMGYPTVVGKTFYSDHWGKAIGDPKRNIDAGYAYALKLGFPVIVKPNSGTQGTAVALVHDKRSYYRAMKAVFKRDRVALVQRQVRGKDYRIVVLDKEVISAYERIPLNVIGDGKATIKTLLARKQREFVASSRDTQLKLEDPRIAEKLAQQRLSMQSVLYKGQGVYLLDNANLSTGGDSIDVTDRIHPHFRKLAVRLTRDMALRMCGVDIMIDGDISKKSDAYWILEINSAPGLDHYAKSGKAQQKIVENLYLKVLKSMEKK